MPGYLESTVAQKIRDFLDDLDAAPPPTASANEALNLLVSRVRSRRDDAELRKRLRSMLADLADSDAARLPAPQCETLNAEALADELTGLLADSAAVSATTPSRPAVAFLAAALLMAGMALTTGCQKQSPPPRDEAAQRAFDKCAADTSIDHFRELAQLDADDFGYLPRLFAIKKFTEESKIENEETMRSLCGMSADEIRAYIQKEYAPPRPKKRHKWFGRHVPDAVPVYKGVGF